MEPLFYVNYAKIILLAEFVRVTCRKVKFFIPPAHQPTPASVSAQNCI
jgi:hypothetical protein